MYSFYHSSPPNLPNYHPSWQCHPPIGTYSTILPTSPIRNNNESGMFQSLNEPFYREPFDKEFIMNECKKLIKKELEDQASDFDREKKDLLQKIRDRDHELERLKENLRSQAKTPKKDGYNELEKGRNISPEKEKEIDQKLRKMEDHLNHISKSISNSKIVEPKSEEKQDKKLKTKKEKIHKLKESLKLSELNFNNLLEKSKEIMDTLNSTYNAIRELELTGSAKNKNTIKKLNELTANVRKHETTLALFLNKNYER